MKYKDSSGREFTFNASAGNIIRAEKRSGERLLGNILKAAESEEVSDQAEAIFGSTERMCAVLYECSVPVAEQGALSYESFCDSLNYSALFDLMPGVIEVLFEGFAMPGGSQLPDPDPDEGGTEGKKDLGT